MNNADSINALFCTLGALYFVVITIFDKNKLYCSLVLMLVRL